MHATKEIHGSLPSLSNQQHQVDRGCWKYRATSPIQLKVKETLHIQRTQANYGGNRDWGYKLLVGWITHMKEIGGRANLLALIAFTLLSLNWISLAYIRRSHAYKSPSLILLLKIFQQQTLHTSITVQNIFHIKNTVQSFWLFFTGDLDLFLTVAGH